MIERTSVPSRNPTRNMSPQRKAAWKRALSKGQKAAWERKRLAQQANLESSKPEYERLAQAAVIVTTIEVVCKVTEAGNLAEALRGIDLPCEVVGQFVTAQSLKDALNTLSRRKLDDYIGNE